MQAWPRSHQDLRQPELSGGTVAVGLGCAERLPGFGYPIAQGTEPAGHLPTLNVGCQKLRGQKRIEMKY